MKKARCLGLVGGLGVSATTHYYGKIARAHAAKTLPLDMVIAHAETDRVFEYVRAEDRIGLATYLVGFVDRLKAAGAELAALPAVTPHFCVRELINLSPLPILNIFDPLVHEIESRGLKRVAVFGTRFVIQSRLFGYANNVEFCQPKPEEVGYINAVYSDLLQQGRGTKEQIDGLTQLAHTLQQRENVDAILLAGTDLTLLFNETNTDFPYIDCASIHLKHILAAMFGETTQSL